MKYTFLIVSLMSAGAAHAEVKHFYENKWCDTVVSYVMKGWDANKRKKNLESLIAIPDQQERLLALQGWRAAQDNVSKAEAYVYFMQQCLAANKKQDEE
jgi:hypothetical protein